MNKYPERYVYYTGREYRCQFPRLDENSILTSSFVINVKHFLSIRGFYAQVFYFYDPKQPDRLFVGPKDISNKEHHAILLEALSSEYEIISEKGEPNTLREYVITIKDKDNTD